ncbi:MAG: hypothetical protein ACPGUD_07870 [Parashewanella sp.]
MGSGKVSNLAAKQVASQYYVDANTKQILEHCRTQIGDSDYYECICEFKTEENGSTNSQKYNVHLSKDGYFRVEDHRIRIAFFEFFLALVPRTVRRSHEANLLEVKLNSLYAVSFEKQPPEVVSSYPPHQQAPAQTRIALEKNSLLTTMMSFNTIPVYTAKEVVDPNDPRSECVYLPDDVKEFLQWRRQVRYNPNDASIQKVMKKLQKDYPHCQFATVKKIVSNALTRTKIIHPDEVNCLRQLQQVVHEEYTAAYQFRKQAESELILDSRVISHLMNIPSVQAQLAAQTNEINQQEVLTNLLTFSLLSKTSLTPSQVVFLNEAKNALESNSRLKRMVTTHINQRAIAKAEAEAESKSKPRTRAKQQAESKPKSRPKKQSQSEYALDSDPKSKTRPKPKPTNRHKKTIVEYK